MLSFSWKYFKVIWIVLCIIATMSTTIWQLWSYVNGDDITVVGYKKFNASDDNKSIISEQADKDF